MDIPAGSQFIRFSMRLAGQPVGVVIGPTHPPYYVYDEAAEAASDGPFGSAPAAAERAAPSPGSG
ncbi:MAG: hypothetical protein JWP35_2935 [Caulobacter sp.]|nr:hypothetical protein [Caulobacter sp.]